MIIGFGFGSPLTALIMLLLTGLITYRISKAIKKWRSTNRQQAYSDEQKFDPDEYKRKKRDYYFEQREWARDMMKKYDLTDEEIERKIENELK